VNVFGSAGWQKHLKTKSHLSKATVVDVEPEPARTKGAIQYCDFCGSTVNRRDWENHINTMRHRSKVTFARYRAAIEDSEKAKNGLAIDGDLDFGFVPPHDTVAGRKIFATITTTQPISHSVLLSIRLASSQGLGSKRSAAYVLLHQKCKFVVTNMV
jgi:helicase MOV-10